MRQRSVDRLDPRPRTIDAYERARATRAREIRRMEERPADDIPDRLPEGWDQLVYVDGKKTWRPTGPRGRKPGSKCPRKPKEPVSPAAPTST